MDLLGHHGPLPASVLLENLGAARLPPFLREAASEPAPTTFQRFLHERPALFAARAAAGGGEAWTAVPGAPTWALKPTSCLAMDRRQPRSGGE